LDQLVVVVVWRMVRFKNRYIVVSVLREADETAALLGDGAITAAHHDVDVKRKKKRQRTTSRGAAATAGSGGGGSGSGDTPWLSARDLQGALSQSLAHNFGEAGVGRALPSLAVRFADARSGVAVVRAARDASEHVRAALLLTTALRNGGAVAMHVAHVAGSMRTCRPAALAAVRRRYGESSGLDAVDRYFYVATTTNPDTSRHL